MPPQDGAAGDQPVYPQPCWHEADERGGDRVVCPVEPGPGMGAAQHGDFVPVDALDRPAPPGQPRVTAGPGNELVVGRRLKPPMIRIRGRSAGQT